MLESKTVMAGECMSRDRLGYSSRVIGSRDVGEDQAGIR